MYSKQSILKFYVIILTMFIYSVSYSDEIILKTGKKVEGSIIEETTNSIKLIIKNGSTLQIKREDIKETRKTGAAKIDPNNAVPSITDKLKFRIGLYGGITLPLGELSSTLDVGGGINILLDLRIPLTSKNVNLRPGIRVGFSYFGGLPFIGTGTNLTFLPVLFSFEFSYDFYAGPVIIKPILGIIGGGAITMGQTSHMPMVTEFNGTVGGTAGIGLQILSIRKIEFFITADYLLIFNTPVLGHFLSINLGMAYRFDGSWGDKNEKQTR